MVSCYLIDFTVGWSFGELQPLNSYESGTDT
jgi:hypothetical protein